MSLFSIAVAKIEKEGKSSADAKRIAAWRLRISGDISSNGKPTSKGKSRAKMSVKQRHATTKP